MTNYFQVKSMQNLLVRKYFYLWLAEFWTVLIAFLCLTSFKKLPSIGVKSADKYVHFTFYFVFTILWFLYFNNKPSNSNKSSKALVLKVFLASFFYGVFIEIAQSLFTTTRKGDLLDVIANTTGALGAVFILVLWGHYFTKKDIQIK